MEPTTHTPEWTRANRRFYALARQCNLTSEDIAATIAGNYQPRISTRELTADELTALCQALQKRATTRGELFSQKVPSRVFFQNQPRTIIEAAQIDGASD